MKALVIVGAVLLLFGCTSMEESQNTEGVCEIGDECSSNPAYLYIPFSEITTSLKYYTYEHEGTTIEYFAVLDSNNEVKVAFDACDVCFNAHKGYSQDGDSVICNNCGLKFNISDLGTKNQGMGCWPSYLAHEIDGDRIAIQKTDIETGSYLFS